MTIIEKQTVKYYHKYRIKNENYSTAQKQGWTNKEVQQLRFKAFCELVDFNNKVILDVGCGYGDFKVYLDKEYKKFDYIGIDNQTEFISEAKTKFGCEQGIWFYNTDVSICQLPNSMDIVIASGLFSYRSDNENYYKDMITKLFDTAEETLLFNMLDDQKFTSGELIVAHNKKEIFDYCKCLSNNVAIKEDYLNIDFTICMRKGK